MSTTIYIVAIKSDEYDHEAILPDILRTSPDTPSFNSHEYSRNRAFLTLDVARRYHELLDGQASFSDGSGNMKDEMSIFTVELARQ